MGFFESLETTSIAIWVGESLWGYPLLLSLHVIGLAMAVGIFWMRDLSLIGGGLTPRGLRGLLKIGWIGLIINALSGLALFTSQATTFIFSKPFLLKIGAIVIATTIAAMIGQRVRRLAESDGPVVVPDSLRALAGVSLCAWGGAIVAGRLIAYF